MTNTYDDTASIEEKTLEEIRCLRCVMERILRVMDEGLFVDYQMEKFGKGPKNQPEELKSTNSPIIYPGKIFYDLGTGAAPTTPSQSSCENCFAMKQLQEQHPNGYVGDTPCQWCPHGPKVTC